MSHATSEQPALTPAMSRNPLSASEPWNLVAGGYGETTMLAGLAGKDAVYAEDASDFGRLVGGGREVMKRIHSQKTRLRHYLTTYILPI